jgi:hypothetical protein
MASASDFDRVRRCTSEMGTGEKALVMPSFAVPQAGGLMTLPSMSSPPAAARLLLYTSN